MGHLLLMSIIMSRVLRLELAEVPSPIVQRGINREPCFFAEEDYHCYLLWLKEAGRKTKPRQQLDNRTRVLK